LVLVGFSPRPCVHTHHVYSRTHRRGACGRHNASLPDGARRDVRDRAVERLFLYARSSTSRQLREVGSPHGRRARSRARRLSRRRYRGVTYSRLRRRSLFSQRAGSAPRVRMDVRCTRGAQGTASRPRQQASNVVRLPASAMCTHHVYTRTHRRSARGRHIASLRDGETRRTRLSRRAPLLVCAEFDVATAARGQVHAWEKRALAHSSSVASSFPRRDIQSSSSSVALQSAPR